MYIIPRFSQIAQEARLMPERLDHMKLRQDLLPDKCKMLTKILYQQKHALAWDFSHIQQIQPEITPLQKIQVLEHEAWQAPSFPIFKELMKTVVNMLKARINSGMLEFCNRLYQNSWFLVKKRLKKY